MKQVLKVFRVKNFLQKSTIALFVVWFMIGPLIPFIKVPQAHASFSQNNSTGTWDVNFNNNQQGIAPDGAPLRENITIDPTAGIAKLTPTFSSGYFNTVAVSPSSFTSWDKVIVDATYSTSTDVRISLYTCSNVPIVGFQNMTLGAGGVIDISALSTSNTCVKARADLTDSGGARPIINDIKITWVPLPVLLITHSANTTRPVGDGVVYAINYSVSFVDDPGVVVWAPLPRVSDGTVTDFTSSYGITPDPTFVQASNGGQYTSTSITVGGISVPGNSVYWNLGLVSAGRSGTLTYEVATQNNWQNNIKYLSQAYIDSSSANQVISDNDAGTIGNQKLATTLSSSPSASIDKWVTGVVRFNNENYVANSGAYTNTATYHIKIKNARADSGREKIWNPVITDNLSDIYSKLSTVCGVGTPASRVSPNNGGSKVGNTIVWDVPSGDLTHLGSNEEKEVTYTVDYTGCPGDATRKYNNTATLSADNINPISDIEAVKIGVNTGPGGIFSKGGPDMANGTVVYHNDTYIYTLNSSNNGAVDIGDIVMVDKMDPLVDLVSVSTPSNSGAITYYNAGGAANAVTTPPAYTLNPGTGVTGSGWTTTKPTTVNWVLVYVPCLDSKYFPSPVGNVACFQKPNAVTATLTVKLKPPAAVCSEYTVPNTGLFSLSATSPTLSNVTLSPVTTLNYTDALTTKVIPKLGIFSTESEIIAPNSAHVTDTITYTINVKNTGVDTAVNTQVAIDIPKAVVNGVTNTPFDFVSASGGTLITTNLPNTLTVQLGNIPEGVTRSILVTLSPPKGIKNLDVATLNASITATDDNNCRPITATLSKTVTVTSEPEVQIIKSRVESLIPSANDVHYTVQFNNVGNAPTTNTYIVDFIPTNTVFKRAYTTGTDAAGTTFNCPNCTVLFSDSLPSLPPGASPFDVITLTDITTAFSPGTQISPGVWTSPYGTNTHWVAYAIDNPSLAPAMLVTGRTGTVGLTVTNDANGTSPGTAGSPSGDIITNEAAIFSNELLQAIGNQVQTTIAPAPGLSLVKRADVATVAGGEIFNWLVDLYNDGSGSDNIVTITDTMNPLGGTLQGVYFTWNAVAIGNGASAGEVNITADPNINLTNNLDGTITINFNLTAFKGGNLNPLEGGTLRFQMLSDVSITTGMNLQNNVSGTYTAGAITETATAEHTLPVANPDLWIRKTVDTTSPLPGDTVTFTLTLSNEGNHRAPDVNISDTLPLGICFSAGSTTLLSPIASGYTIPVPVITGDCITVPQTITWNNTIITPIGTTIVPANSPDISFSYRTTITGTVASGVTLVNGATVSTTLAEDTVYTNNSNQSVTTPLPDPYVRKSAAATAIPGSPLPYTITYGNNSRQSVANVYMVDTLPDFDNDGTADITFVSISGTGGESFYYNASPVSLTPPAFNPASPLSGGWTAAPGPVVSYIAIRKTTLASLEGPRTITMSTTLTDPDTTLPVPTGVALVNKVTINGVGDGDLSNNTATVTTRTPGFDLLITKTATRSGAVPGLVPGASNTYTLTYKNQGTASACDVHIRDTLGTNLSFVGTGHNFTSISLVDNDGNSITPVDSLNTLISNPPNPTVTLSGNVLTADLGVNLCIPPGAQQSFEVYAKVGSSVTDGIIVANLAEIYTTGSSVEQIQDNNNAIVNTTVWRADVVATKTGVVTPGGSATLANPGETIRYTIEYDNIGNADADNTILTDTIPSEVCFVVGSISSIPGTTIQYSNDNGTTWTYVPVGATGAQDCNVKNFRILWNTPLPAPANFDGEGTLVDFVNAGELNVQEITNNGKEVLTLGDGAVWSPFTYPTGTASIGPYFTHRPIVGDFNKDGKMDTAQVWGPTTPPSPASNFNLVVSTGDGSGTGWISTTTTNIGVTANPVWHLSADQGDFNEDGNVDFILGWGSSGVTPNPGTQLFLGNGLGGFTQSLLLSSANTSQITNIKVADFNNDHHKDVIIISSTVGTSRIGLGNGLGGFTFSSLPSTLVTGAYDFLNTGDFNGDGNVDIIRPPVASVTPAYIYLGNGLGGFTLNTSLPITTTTGTNGMVVGYPNVYDFNHDGFDDIFACGGSICSLILGNNSGTFSGFSFTTSLTNGYLFADFNNDNFPDIYRANINSYYPGTNSFPYFGTLKATTTFVSMSGTASITDFNGDGKKDIIIASSTIANNKIYINHFNEYLASGTYTTNITASNPITAWNKLLVNADVPTNTSLTYTVLPSTCTGTAYVNAQAAPQGYIDISHIPNTVTSLCLRMNFATTDVKKTPTLDAWKATYSSPIKPKFIYDAIVKTSPQLGVIPNSVQMSTTTPEINTGNNDSIKEHQLIVADVSIKKVVDKSAALAGDTLTYTLTYKNDGPSTAQQVTIGDTLPIGVGSPSSMVVSGTTGTVPVCTHSAGVIYCDNDGNSATVSTWSLNVNDTGIITITVPILGTATAGDILTNSTNITTTTYQIDTDNDTDTVNTIIGTYPNLFIEKTGPTKANVDKDIIYTISYGNNGNAPATDVTITDTFDPNVTIVSAVSTDPSMGACSNTTTTITCGGAGYTLPVGTTYVLTVTLHVNNDFNLLVNHEIINNNVSISTTAAESSISDNASFYDIPVYPFGLSSISGYVYIDTNGNTLKDLGESGISSVIVSLTGTDIYGTVVSRSTNTDGSGLYTFSGLNPGTYTITENQPSGYDSTGATAGTNLVSGNGTVSGVNMISSISLGEGSDSVENNFGEASGSLGNQVFYDQNTNGTFDGGDIGLAGVRILLITDTNNNGMQDVGESVRVTYTDTTGNYQFTNLPFANYIVKVSDTAGVLSSYTAVAGISTGGLDNDAKNTTGYTATLSGITPSLQGADFGYTLTPFTSGSSGTIGTKIFEDFDGNGILDGSDTGIANVSVDMYRDNDSSGTVTFGDTFLGRLFTDTNGDYLFGGLTLDRRYVVRVSDTLGNLAGYINTLGAPNTDNNGQSPLAYPVYLQTGVNESTITADFSYQPPAPDLRIVKSHTGLNVQGGTATYNLTVSNKITATGNATSPIRVTDTLVSDLTYVSATGTDWDCSATVAPLVDCTYTGTYPVTPGTTLPTLAITATISAGALPPLINSGSVSTPLELAATLADNTASDPVTYVAASADGVIGTTVWVDEDGDGEHDITEPGISGVTVRLYRDWDADGLPDDLNADLTIDINDEIKSAQVTDGNGEYLFTGLDRDDLVNGYYDYLVTVDTTTIPVGHTHTTGTVNTDNFSQIETNYAIRLSNTDPANVTADFGYQPPSPDLTITKTHTGVVHQGDNVTFTMSVANAAGFGDVPNTNEIMVSDTMPAGMTLIPSATVTATNAISSAWNCSTSTATLLRCISIAGLANGSTLPNIAAVIEVNPVSVPTTITNIANVSTVRETVANTANNTASDDVPVVLTNTGSIGNIIWDDQNGNGHHDSGESGIGGVRVYLYRDVNEDGTIDPGDTLLDTQITSTTLGTIGEYQFVNLERDLGLGYYPYIVRVETTDVTTINALYVQSIGAPGVDDESQVQDYQVTLNSTTASNQTADFGFKLPPELTLTKTISGSSVVHVGQSMTFLIEVANIGGGTTNGSDIIITDTLPANLTFSTIGSSPECTAVGQLVTCTLTGIPAVLAAYTGSYSFTIVSVADATGVISNSADVSGGGISGTVTSAPSTGSVITPNLRITKSHIGTLIQGGSVTYNLVVTNLASATADATSPIRITDTLVSDLTYVSTTGTDWDCSATVAPLVDCTYTGTYPVIPGTILPTLAITATISASAINSIANTANVIVPLEAPSVLANNTATDTAYVYLSSNGTIGNLVWNDTDHDGFKDPTESGIGNVTINLYHDLGIIGAYEPGIDILVDTQTTLTNGSYAFTNLDRDNGTGSYDYLVRVDNTSVLNSNAPQSLLFTNTTGAVNTNNNGQNPNGYAVSLGTIVSNQTADFGYTLPAAWTITKTGTPLTGISGTPATFTISITNSGGGNTVGSYTVTDTLAAGMLFDTVGSDTRCSAVGQVVTCTDTLVLTPGASTTFDIKVTIAAVGSYPNEASVTGGGAVSATSSSITIVRTSPPSGGGGGGGSGMSCPVGQILSGGVCVSPVPVNPVITPKPSMPNTSIESPSSLRKSRLGLLWQTGNDVFGVCGYPVLTTPIRLGKQNKVSDVKFLEQFLNTYEGETLTINGIYEQTDFDAVVRWQEKYADAVLTPWGVTKGTGYVYKTSLAQIVRQYKTVCSKEKVEKQAVAPLQKLEVPLVNDSEIVSISTDIIGTRIRIPNINLDKVVYTTGTLKQAKDNVWHSPDTEMPDQGGNTVFVGHRYVNLVRDAQGNVVQIPPKPGVFFELPAVPVGSDIYVTYNNREYHYKVTQSFEVRPDEIWVEDETINPTLTLYTCTPLYTHNKRHVVRAELVKN